MFKKAWMLKWGLNLWPPTLLAGIHVVELSADYRYAKVELRMRPWNKNAVGSHFGGSIFSMTDPMYMLMLLANFYGEYYVWDKAADIDFIKPGLGTLTAEFNITDGLLTQIKEATADGSKYLPELPVLVKDESGEVVARLNRKLYLRKKKT
jgi:acyl-coenzyme A thioesterase PaaI-like protein